MIDPKATDWFNMDPDADELKQQNEAMLEHFAQETIASKRPEDLTNTVPDIIDILTSTQLYWGAATRRDLTTEKKRYISTYDMVRRAYSNIP